MATVHLRVIGRLQALCEAPDDAVAAFEDYVATLTYNVLHDHLRRRYPERTRLRNRLRYVLTRDPRLALWDTPAGPAAGLAAWRGRSETGPLPVEATDAMRDAKKPADAVAEIVRAAGRPVTLDALVQAAGEWWGITDVHAALAEQGGSDTALQFENREFLRALWREIRELPAAQRKALLLNLRDPETVNVAALIALTGTAPFDDIAAAVELTARELAEIWNDLPLDDLRIASLLGMTRQQVINLRKSARQRLARRMRTGT